jgi:adhesin transport system membrane fusion protein
MKLLSRRKENNPATGGNGKRLSVIVWLLLAVLGGLIAWANYAVVDEAARATGTVIASSRIQVIQSVDGGVLEKLNVREGDSVKEGVVLAVFDETRTRAALAEIEAKRAGLHANLARLEGEFYDHSPRFPAEVSRFPELRITQQAMYDGRRRALNQELKSLSELARFARQELAIVEQLVKTGDASEIEMVRLQRMASEAEGQLANRRNKYIQDVSTEMARVREELEQVQQQITQRRQQLANLVLKAPMSGTVKNVRFTTVGGVLRPGDELMQIVPTDDQLMVEAKVMTKDIGRLRPHLPATIRFDAFDYAVYGSVEGEVTYISADSMRDETQRNDSTTYYRVHVRTVKPGPVTSIGKRIDVIPGMTATIDIRVGERTVLAYLLKPFTRIMTESFREH